MTPELGARLKRAGITALAAVLVAVAGFSAGRFSAPLEVEERLVVVNRERSQTTHSEAKDRREDRIVWRDRVVTKDGEVRERVVEKLVAVDLSKLQTRSDAERASETTSETKTTVRPDWRVGALGGGRFNAGPVGVVAGAMVERRIIGGVSVAGWGMVEIVTQGPAPSVSGGSIGLGVTVEF